MYFIVKTEDVSASKNAITQLEKLNVYSIHKKNRETLFESPDVFYFSEITSISKSDISSFLFLKFPISQPQISMFFIPKDFNNHVISDGA